MGINDQKYGNLNQDVVSIITIETEMQEGNKLYVDFHRRPKDQNT